MAITVPTVGSEINVALFGKPVVDAINGMSPTAWTLLPLNPGWSNYNVNSFPQIRKVGDNVQLRGIVTGAAGAANAIFSNVPAMYRPNNDRYSFSVVAPSTAVSLNIFMSGEITASTGVPVAYLYVVAAWSTT
jgi:hypothetical protein